ncbi:MAG: hypothetical protein ACYC91_11550 [Solirubrobacteraceae bacterium]
MLDFPVPDMPVTSTTDRCEAGSRCLISKRSFTSTNSLKDPAFRRGSRACDPARNGYPVRAGELNSGMSQNFIDCDREQAFLLPPSLRDWLPEDHLAWFVIDAVSRLDLEAFYAAYRADGHGRAAYEPSMMA